MKKSDILAKFPKSKTDKWTRKKTKPERDKDRDERIKKWEVAK